VVALRYGGYHPIPQRRRFARLDLEMPEVLLTRKPIDKLNGQYFTSRLGI
jgi:hypothetical protein